jgi:hypothetical protein
MFRRALLPPSSEYKVEDSSCDLLGYDTVL